jgi:predicted RNA-binding Zn-ribbon protein involved in translation (DUF1610 family)
MLSVGREINIESKNLHCGKCAWQGHGPQLAKGLVRVNHSDIYVYAYRCPDCGSFDLASKGTLLAFRLRVASVIPDTIEQSAKNVQQSVESRRRN